MISVVTYYGVEDGVNLEYEENDDNRCWGASVSPRWTYSSICGFGPTIEGALQDLKVELECRKSDYDMDIRSESR